MQGMSATTGRPLDGADHIKQSITDVLTTRIGTRVMRRDYGSRLPELVDNPMGEFLKVELFAATAEALAKWEPRFRLDRVYLQSATEDGHIVLALEGIILINNEPIRLEGIEIA
ncbi:MAG: baseplate assembly protein W [Sulfitobacter sp.]|nr:baseplate assembly protein W [Sulfitobacter sp.]